MSSSIRNDMKVNPVAGAMSALQYLQPGALLGVATGNLQTIGRLKLNLAGFDDSFTFGSFSDGIETREDVFAKAMADLPRSITEGQTCFVGDTPRDVEAAHHCGCPVVAVATGTYSFDELLASSPEYCVRNLNELL